MYLVKIESAAKNIKDIENISMPTQNGYVRIKDFAQSGRKSSHKTRLCNNRWQRETTEGIVLGLGASEKYH